MVAPMSVALQTAIIIVSPLPTNLVKDEFLHDMTGMIITYLNVTLELAKTCQLRQGVDDDACEIHFHRVVLQLLVHLIIQIIMLMLMLMLKLMLTMAA